jgi:hypothetical protein
MCSVDTFILVVRVVVGDFRAGIAMAGSLLLAVLPTTANTLPEHFCFPGLLIYGNTADVFLVAGGTDEHCISGSWGDIWDVGADIAANATLTQTCEAILFCSVGRVIECIASVVAVCTPLYETRRSVTSNAVLPRVHAMPEGGLTMPFSGSSEKPVNVVKCNLKQERTTVRLGVVAFTLLA